MSPACARITLALTLVASSMHQGMWHDRETCIELGRPLIEGQVNYGYHDCDACFATIMAYMRYCQSQGCSSVANIPYFSNPEISVTNSDTGVV